MHISLIGKTINENDLTVQFVMGCRGRVSKILGTSFGLNLNIQYIDKFFYERIIKK